MKSKRRTAAIIQNRTITNQQVRRIDSRSLGIITFTPGNADKETTRKFSSNENPFNSIIGFQKCDFFDFCNSFMYGLFSQSNTVFLNLVLSLYI